MEIGYSLGIDNDRPLSPAAEELRSVLVAHVCGMGERYTDDEVADALLMLGAQIMFGQLLKVPPGRLN